MSLRRSPRAWPAFIAVVLTGCAQTGSQTTLPEPSPSVTAPSDSIMPAEVLGVTWQWMSLTTPVEQVTVDAPDRYTIRFDRAGRVAVRADCNRGTTSYVVGADRRITFRPMALTKAMCPAGSLSDRFVKDVGRATSYFVKDGELYLSLPVDSGTLRFRRQG